MKIYIGSDHRGYNLKSDIKEYLRRSGHEIIDEGDSHYNPEDDYPQFAGKVVHALRIDNDPNARGLLLCGSGQGMAMAANRVKGIRATLGYDLKSAQAGRNDEDSNVLCLPTDSLTAHQAQRIIDVWLSTPFVAAPRYIRRIRELDEL